MVHLLMETLPVTRGEESLALHRARTLDAEPEVRARVVRGLERDPESLTTVLEFDDPGLEAPTPPLGAHTRRYRVVADFVSDDYDPRLVTVLQGVLFDTDAADDLAAWYADEHMPLLFRVPGWLRCRRAELVSGDGPRYLALHELTGVEVATDPIGDAARSTPWRDRIMATITRSERELYEVLDAP